MRGGEDDIADFVPFSQIDPTEIVNHEMRGGPDSGSCVYWTRHNNPDLGCCRETTQAHATCP
jgi:hypothetical protein